MSQHALGERVGLPQSHISKIESGRSDLKLSSLVELSRALGLEIKLVPRAVLPAVDSLLKATPRDSDSTHLAVDRINQARRAAEHLSEIEPIKPELARLQQTLGELEHHRFSPPDFSALSKALEPLDLIRRRFAQLDLPAERLGHLAEAFVSPLENSVRSLAALRNHLAHSRTAETAKPRPAYRLEDDRDG